MGAGGAYLLALGGGVLIGPGVAIAFVVVGSLFLLLVGASSDVVQRYVPAVGRLPLVDDQDFRVVPGSALDRLESELRNAEAERIAGREPGPTATNFQEIKARVEGYLEEARAMWTELAERPPPDRVGALYDQAVDWQTRVIDDLRTYHQALAREFRRGGSLQSPQLGDIAPTDGPTLQICVERRGQVLRNFLDGTPGLKLEWNGPVSFF